MSILLEFILEYLADWCEPQSRMMYLLEIINVSTIC